MSDINDDYRKALRRVHVNVEAPAEHRCAKTFPIPIGWGTGTSYNTFRCLAYGPHVVHAAVVSGDTFIVDGPGTVITWRHPHE